MAAQQQRRPVQPQSSRGSWILSEPRPNETPRVAQAVLEQGRLLRLACGALPERARDLLHPQPLLGGGDRDLAGVELALPERESLQGIGREGSETAGRVGDEA